jgi:hypothetical protein
MKAFSLRTMLPLLALLTAGTALFAEDAVSLFDGKTLTGWTLTSGKPIAMGWEVADGTIHRAARGGDIVTEKQYHDFILEFEFKVAPKTNSGVKYRWGRYGNQRIGIEYQVADATASDTKGKHGIGSLYDLFAPSPNGKSRPTGEWNTAKIIAQGDRIEHWLNGEKVVSVTVGSPEWKDALAKSKFKEQADFGTKPGPILLQDHGTEVWYRNLRIQELKPEAK